MKITDLRDKSVDQLKELVVEMKKELFNLRFQQTSGELENTSRFAEVRKIIAQAKTLLGEKSNPRRMAGSSIGSTDD